MAIDSAIPTSTQSTRGNPAWGLAWGGAMLIVLAFWLRAKFEDLSLLFFGAVGLLGALAVAFAAWQLFQASRHPVTIEMSAQRRRQTGIVCIVGGVAMVVLAVILGFVLGLAGFGEYLGLGLFGLVAIACGLGMQMTTALDTGWINFLQARLGLVRLELWVFGVGMILAFLFLKFGPPDVDLRAWFPEMMALLVGGLFYLWAAFWLQLQSVAGPLPATKLRVFILLLGGATGLIITLMILIRMFLWRDQVFLGGIEVWTGEGSWRLWLCAYVLLAGLALMFGSLLLARADIHQNPVLRRGLYGYNTVFNGVMLLAILILANILFYILFPYTFNWSRTSFSSLAPSTKNLLGNLKEPTTFYVVMGENHPATHDLRILLENAQAENPAKVKVEFISPDRQPKKYLDLARTYKELEPERTAFGATAKRGVLVVYGQTSEDPNAKAPPHAFVPDNRVFEQKSNTPPGMPPEMARGKVTQVFKAEPEVMKELSFLSAGQKKRKLYVLQGDGELDINNSEAGGRVAYNEPFSNLGMGKLVDRLKKDQFEVQGLKFVGRLKEKENIVVVKESGPDKKKDIPEDADVVLIPGPSEEMSKETLDALERYVDHNGRLIVFFDTVFDAGYKKMRVTGLEEFLKKYGVDVRPEYALSPDPRGGDPREVIATTPRRAETVLAKQFARKPLVLYTTRVVKALPASGRFKADVLYELDDKQFDFWAEESPLAITDINAYVRKLNQNINELRNKIMQEPLPVAVTVTDGTGDLARPRMVVFGDVEFIMNEEEMLNRYYDLIASSLGWLAGSEGGVYVGPRPRETPNFNVPVGIEPARLYLYPALLMTLSVAGLGAGLWIVRRR